MQHINTLTKTTHANSPQPNGLPLPAAMTPATVELCRVFKSLPADSQDRQFLAAFWLRMAEAYRQLWTSSQGEVPTDLWAKCLLKVGSQRANLALVDFLKSGTMFPPTLPEFIAAAKPAPMCQQLYKALPKPTPDPILARAAFRAMKAVL